MANNAISSIGTKKSDMDQTAQSAVWIVVITLLALLLGWLIKGSIENRVQVKEHGGVRAEFPAGWKIEVGLNDEQFIFGGSDPFDPTLSYSVRLMPASSDMKVTDLVVTHNLERGQKLNSYKVLDQTSQVVNGQNAYRVHFAYVLPGSNDQAPLVVEGLDYYFFNQPKSMVVTLEENTTSFEDAQPRFLAFLQKVSMAGGK
jgi:hypothetical protein